ncbi:MAG: hypothetical protein M3R41_03980 [Pseudomonadota bacterium]|nr:hypothetical protein [Pseudomonadota bacterium]
MADSIHPLRLLRHQIAALERTRSPIAARVSIGHADIDAATGGGLVRGRLHEVFALDAADAGSAAGFAGMLAHRLGGSIVWLREDAAERQSGRLHAAGLAEIGVDPRQLIMGLSPDPLAVLRAAADVVRCSAVGVAVIEVRRNPPLLDLTASRRLALAAEASGVTVLLVRIDAVPAPSAADTRWAIRTAPSTPLEANAPGHPALDIELLRQRGRPADHRWQVEWDRERTAFRAHGESRAPLSGAMVRLVADRSAVAGGIVPRRRTG